MTCENCQVPETVFCGGDHLEYINGKCEYLSAPKTSPVPVNACVPRTLLGLPMKFLLGCDRLLPECGDDLQRVGLTCAPKPCLNGGDRGTDGVCRQPKADTAPAAAAPAPAASAAAAAPAAAPAVAAPVAEERTAMSMVSKVIRKLSAQSCGDDPQAFFFDEYKKECKPTSASCFSRNGEFYELEAPTQIADRVCARISAACDPATHYEASAPTPFSDRVCKPLTQCQADEYQTKASTASSDRECAKLTQCDHTDSASPTFQSQPPTAESDAVCSPVTACPNGTLRAATGTSDAVCSMIAPSFDSKTCGAGAKFLMDPNKCTRSVAAMQMQYDCPSRVATSGLCEALTAEASCNSSYTTASGMNGQACQWNAGTCTTANAVCLDYDEATVESMYSRPSSHPVPGSGAVCAVDRLHRRAQQIAVEDAGHSHYLPFCEAVF
jgi:hypothetical protein